MDFVQYWFMFPTAILVSTTSMLSGIGGAALFMPIFLIVFPLLGPDYPLESTIAAIGVALLTQTFGFASGFVAYWRKGLIDYKSALPFIAVAMPVAVAGALVAHRVDGTALKGAYAVLMGVLALVMLSRSGRHAQTATSDGATPKGSPENSLSSVTDRNGHTYSYPTPRQGIGAIATAVGAFFTGLVSTGIGEVIMPQLVKRNRVPVAVAAATSVLIAIATVAAASATQVSGMILKGGVAAVPWNLVFYTIPGVLIGGQLGPHLQGRVSQRTMVRAIGALFVVIGLAMAWIVSGEMGLRR